MCFFLVLGLLLQLFGGMCRVDICSIVAYGGGREAGKERETSRGRESLMGIELENSLGSDRSKREVKRIG
jgi:hypothetical protein